VSYNMQYGMPGSQPSWTENYLAGLQNISAPDAQNTALPVPFSPVSANGTLPVAAPRPGVLSGLGKLGGWLGKNAQTIGTFGNLFSQGINAYVGLQQLGLAKDAFKFEKAAFKTNLANQVDSYNTQMKDRTTGRWYATEEERQAALKDAELPPGMRG
jgi:hypothetical protein